MEETKEIKCIIELTERVDRRKVNFLLKLDVIHDDKDKNEQASGLLTSYTKSYKKARAFKAEYKTSKKWNPWGRIYPYVKFGRGGSCTGLTMFDKEIRSYLAQSTYRDIDMKKAHWYILKHLFHINDLVKQRDMIDTIIYNYDNICEYILDGRPQGIDGVKPLLFSLLYTCPAYMSLENKDLLENIKELSEVHRTLYGTFLTLMKSQFNDLFKLTVKNYKKKGNVDGSFISTILQHHERLFIMEIIEMALKAGYEVGAIIHDGFLLTNESILRSSVEIGDFFIQVYEKMKSKYEHLEVFLVQKPFQVVREGWPQEIEEDDERDDMTEYELLCKIISDNLVEYNLVLDGYRVHQKNKTHPMRYDIVYQSYHDYIVYVFRDTNNSYRRHPGTYDQLISFLEKRKTFEVRPLEPDLDWIAFQNGALQLSTRNFVPLEKICPKTAPIARHYIDCSFDPENFETPLIDKILKFQLGDDTDGKEAIRWFFIFIARLFFKPSNDSFHAIPYLQGLASTGKSTMINIISALFPPNAIGTINSTMEQTFGLDNFKDKQVILSSDLPEDLAKTLSMDLLKAMVSGETINMPVKYGKSRTEQWTIPCMLVSNYMPNYNNSNRAVSKRLAIIRFQNDVPSAEKDTTLEARIKSTELASLINKILKLYFEVKDIPKTFEDIAPEYFKKTTNEYCETVDTLFQFLNQPDYIARDGLRHKIDFGPDCYELLSKIEFKYQAYCSSMRIKPTWIKGDYSVFSKFNCKVQPAHICKSCLQRSRANCCPKYSAANRKKLLIVIGMRFVTEKDDMPLFGSGAKDLL